MFANQHLGPQPINYNNAPSGVPNLYIIALPNDFTTEQLVSLFSQFGEIESARLMVSREVPLLPNRSFAFVLFKSVQAAMDAVARGHGMRVGDSTIQVYIARPKAQTNNAKPSVYTAKEGFQAPPPARRAALPAAQPYGSAPLSFMPTSMAPPPPPTMPVAQPQQFVVAQLPNGQTAIVPVIMPLSSAPNFMAPSVGPAPANAPIATVMYSNNRVNNASIAPPSFAANSLASTASPFAPYEAFTTIMPSATQSAANAKSAEPRSTA